MSAPTGGRFDIAAQTFHRSKKIEEEEVITSFFLKKKGGKLWISGYSDQINQYDLDEFKLNTIKVQEDQEFGVAKNSPDIGTPLDFYFGDDGLQFYVLTEYSNLHSFTCRAQYETQNAIYFESFDFSNQDDLMKSIYFRDNGKTFYAAGEEGGKIYEYNLEEKWDITTIYFSGVSYSLSYSSVENITVQQNGKRFWVINGNENKIYDYYTQTAWDIPNLSVVQSVKIQEDKEIKDFLWTKDIGGELGSEFILVGNEKNSVYSFN